MHTVIKSSSYNEIKTSETYSRTGMMRVDIHENMEQLIFFLLFDWDSCAFHYNKSAFLQLSLVFTSWFPHTFSQRANNDIKLFFTLCQMIFTKSISFTLTDGFNLVWISQDERVRLLTAVVVAVDIFPVHFCCTFLLSHFFIYMLSFKLHVVSKYHFSRCQSVCFIEGFGDHNIQQQQTDHQANKQGLHFSLQIEKKMFSGNLVI